MTINKLARRVAGALLLTCSSLPALAANVVDVLVLYTPEAQQTRNGADINARIASYIAYANQAYSKSRVDMQLRLVGAEQLAVPYTYVTSDNLDRFRQNAQVAELRRKYGADLVTLLNLRDEISGGYVCGIGYVPGGDPNSGRLYSNAASAAFSLVGIECGISTMAHELGHNMSLGHSHIQNSNGGVWTWARGHGVQGVFSTIMAYPHSYGTYNQAPVFANPAIYDCNGLACGAEQSRSDGADAASALNRLASQVTGFMSSVSPVDTGTTTPANCNKTAVAGNLISNGEFNTLNGWSSGFGLSTLKLEGRNTNNCTDNVLVIAERSQYHSSAYHAIGSSLAAGTTYRLDAKLAVQGIDRDTVRIALRVQDASGSRYIYLDPISATSGNFTNLTREFQLNADSRVGILVYGSQPGVSILADGFSLVEKSSAQTPADNSDTAVVNEQFEQTANGWRAYRSGTLSYSNIAAQGEYSLLSRGRGDRSSGPSMDVTGSLEPGISYQLSVDGMVTGTGSTSGLQAWLYYTDNRGGHWQNLANADSALNLWHTLKAEFFVQSEGAVSSARLVFIGPDAGYDVHLDNLKVERF